MALSYFLKKYFLFIIAFLALSVFLGFFAAYQNNQYKAKQALSDKLNDIFPLCYDIYNYTSSIHLTGLFMELRNTNDDIIAAIEILNKESVKNLEMFSELDLLSVKTAELKNFPRNNLTEEVKTNISKLIEILENYNRLAVGYLDIKRQYIELEIKDYEFSLANGARRFSSPQSEAIFEAEEKLRDSSNKLLAVSGQYISTVRALAKNLGWVLN